MSCFILLASYVHFPNLTIPTTLIYFCNEAIFDAVFIYLKTPIFEKNSRPKSPESVALKPHDFFLRRWRFWGRRQQRERLWRRRTSSSAGRRQEQEESWPKVEQVNCIFIFFKIWANSGLFFFYFHLFKHTLQILQQIGVWKMSIQYMYQDLNSQPLEHESPPITIRPGLPICCNSFRSS